MLIQLYIVMHINKYLGLFSWISVYIDITHSVNYRKLPINYLLMYNLLFDFSAYSAE